ncbi:hypothetical protein [Streptomyces sp. NPDC008092]|uniref:hypothetical protein n=1 Tax=Streptomyces sp. NPDC008092 TaxID=3364808 RepID=UPI0036EC3FE1
MPDNGALQESGAYLVKHLGKVAEVLRLVAGMGFGAEMCGIALLVTRSRAW